MKFSSFLKLNLQNKSLHNALLYNNVISTIILLVPLIILTTYLISVRYFDQIESASKQVRAETMETIKGRVDETLNYVNFMEKTLEERAKEITKNRTLEAHAIATGLYLQFKDKVPLPVLVKPI